MFLLLLISGVLTGPSLYGCVAAARRLMLHGRHHTLLLGCGQSALGGKFWLSPHQGPLQVCFSLQGMCAPFVLFKGWLWVGAWKVFWGSRSLSHPARGPIAPQAPCLEGEAWWLPLTGLSWLPYNSALVHRVVMVTLRARLLCSPIFPGTLPKLIYC